MDFVSGMGSFFMGVIDTESELKKNLQRIDVLLTRCEKMFNQATFDQVSDKKQIEHYRNILARNKETYQSSTDSLKGIGITKKIAVNLPFNKTKQNLKDGIEQLESMMNELRDKVEPQPMKRKFIGEQKKVVETNENFDPTINQAEEEEMGPTIRDQQDDFKGTWHKVRLEFECQPPKSLERIRKELPHVAITQENFQFKEGQTERVILSFSRMVFKPHYSIVKALLPDIDYISSKDKHMEVIYRRRKIDKQVEKILLSAVKECSHKKQTRQNKPKNQDDKPPARESQQQAQTFFSFPIDLNAIEESLNKEQYEYELVCINYSKLSTFINRKDTDKWQQIPEGKEVTLMCGDRISPFLKRPEKVVASFCYVASFQNINYFD